MNCSIRICIKTSQEDNILERFKIIARGKVFILRAKELFVWSPSFKAAKEADYCSDEDVNKDDTNNIEDDGNYVNGDAESDVECVSDTVFARRRQGMQAKGAANSGCETSLPFPPGFTPDNVPIQTDVQVEAKRDASVNSPLSCHSEGLSSRVMEDAQLINAHDSPRVEHNIKTGGSILDVLENMIKVAIHSSSILETRRLVRCSLLSLVRLRDQQHDLFVLAFFLGSDTKCRNPKSLSLHYGNKKNKMR
ncbi:hypothetical protein Tco_0256605 [Tanacetum coccineum]